MSKLIICHGEGNDVLHGIGNTPKEAYENYKYNDGSDDLNDCKFYEAEEVEIEFTVKRKETAGSAAKKQ